MKVVRGYTIDQENIEYLQERAKKEERSVSWLVNKAIQEMRKREEN